MSNPTLTPEALEILADLDRRHEAKLSTQVQKIMTDLDRRRPLGETEYDRWKRQKREEAEAERQAHEARAQRGVMSQTQSDAFNLWFDTKFDESLYRDIGPDSHFTQVWCDALVEKFCLIEDAQAEFDALRKENAELRRQREALERRLEEMLAKAEERLRSATGVLPEATVWQPDMASIVHARRLAVAVPPEHRPDAGRAALAVCRAWCFARRSPG
jgi:hypothetical protein